MCSQLYTSPRKRGRSSRSDGRGRRLPSHAGQIAGGDLFQVAQPVEQLLRREAGMAGVEAGAEFLEQIGLGERPLGMAAGAADRFALHLAAAGEVDRDLVV